MLAPDLLLVHASEIVALDEFCPRPHRGPLNTLTTIRDGAVAIQSGRVIDIGPTARVISGVDSKATPIVIDATGCAVTPGFVDAHSHMLYAGSRADEYVMRVSGQTSGDISSRGGGIYRTVRETIGASGAHLLELLIGRLAEALRNGTTTIEVKTGYWLTPEGERHALDLIAAAGHRQPVDLVPTFLGAHTFPPEFRADPDGYVERIVEKMLPMVGAASPFCDVVCEVSGFSPDQARRILEAAAIQGLKLKMHADEFADVGAAQLAATLGATSADHLCFISDRGIQALALAQTVAVLLPATRHYLLAPRYADARRLIDAGVAVALGSDHGPSNQTLSMPFVLGLACSALRMHPAEALVAATWNAAHAVGMADRVGCLAPGYQADLLILDIPSYRDLPFFIDRPIVRSVIKKGQVFPGWASRGGDERQPRPTVHVTGRAQTVVGGNDA